MAAGNGKATAAPAKAADSGGAAIVSPTTPAAPEPPTAVPPSPQAPHPGMAPGARPGPVPKPGIRTPRVGNNPFSSAQPADRPIPRPPAPRPGTARPGFHVRAPRPAACRHAPVELSGCPSTTSWCATTRGRPGAPGAGRSDAGGGNYRGGGVGAAPERASAAVPGRRRWPSRAAWRCRRRVRPPGWCAPARPQVQAAEAPGVRLDAGSGRRRARLPHGNGETIRLARGASLSDFADKIDANPRRWCRRCSTSARW